MFESGVIGQSANLSSEDVALFLAVRVSQAPKNSKEVALCEQVYNLKRYPLELRPDNSMASKKERETEDALRQRLQRRIPAMSKACQAYFSAMLEVSCSR